MYKSKTKGGTVWERKMVPSAFNDVPPVTEEIHRRGWEALVAYPKEGYVEMINEFYTNACNPTADFLPHTSYFRGKTFSSILTP